MAEAGLDVGGRSAAARAGRGPYDARMGYLPRLALAIGLTVAVVAGCSAATPNSGVRSSQGPSAAPATVTTPSAAPASVAPSAAVASTPEPTPSPAPTLKATPPPPGTAATIVLTSFRLDAIGDPDGAPRIITFKSQGKGPITVHVRVVSAKGSAAMCLGVDGRSLGCKTTTDGTLSARTTSPKAAFKLTLRGGGSAAPVVEVTITFPASRPAIAIANARFDGTDYPATNGIEALFAPRIAGNVTLKATWGGHPFPYDIDLAEQGGSGGVTLADQEPNIGVSETLPVSAGNTWKLTLRNAAAGFGVTPMTVTIRWP